MLAINPFVVSLNSISTFKVMRLKRDIGAVKQMLKRKEVARNEQLADVKRTNSKKRHIVMNDNVFTNLYLVYIVLGGPKTSNRPH